MISRASGAIEEQPGGHAPAIRGFRRPRAVPDGGGRIHHLSTAAFLCGVSSIRPYPRFFWVSVQRLAEVGEEVVEAALAGAAGEVDQLLAVLGGVGPTSDSLSICLTFVALGRRPVR